MFLYVLILKKMFNSVRLLLPTTRSVRSSSNAKKKNNDLSRFTKYSIFTADLFYIYQNLSEARTSAKIVTISENLSQTPETFYFHAKNYGARIKAHVHAYM